MRYSVIIPAYNAAASVERAVRSVSDYASHNDYEILVVDDGSRDETPRLLEALSQEIPTLRVFSRENGGPASARNFGISQARGECLLFLDADDAFTPHGAEEAVALWKESRASVLIFGYYLTQGEASASYHYQSCRLETAADWRKHLSLLYRVNMLNQVWGKVFETKLLKEKAISFPDLFWGEDRLFFFRALEEAETVAVTDRCCYDYIQQENSLISRFLPEKCTACEEIHQRILSLAAKKEGGAPEGAEVYSYMYVKSLLSAFATLFGPRCPLKGREKREYIREALEPKSQKNLAPFPSDAGLSFRLPALPVRWRWVWGTYLVSYGIHTVSALAPSLFRRAKHAYNQNKGEKE